MFRGEGDDTIDRSRCILTDTPGSAGELCHSATPSRIQIQHGSLTKRSVSLIVKHDGKKKEIESSVYLHIKQF